MSRFNQIAFLKKGTPGKADDAYAGYGTTGGKTLADSNPAIKNKILRTT